MGSNSTSTTYRQWLILQRVPPRHWIGTTELQKALQHEGIDVNLRTIQRDLVALSNLFPLESNGLSPQGWRWQPNAPVAQLPQMASSQALTFMMVEQHLHNLLPPSVLDDLRPWFDAARQQIKQGTAPAHRWTDKVRIVPPTQPLIPPAIDREALHTIQEAVLLSRRLDVLYDSRSKKTALHLELDPLAIIQRGPVLYLVAVGKSLSSGKATEAIRLFAMHRFKKAWLRDEKARKPKGFVLDDYLAQGGLGFGNGKMKKLKIVLDETVGEHLYESRLSKDQVIKKLPNGKLEITATVADTPQLTWWLKGMGVKP